MARWVRWVVCAVGAATLTVPGAHAAAAGGTPDLVVASVTAPSTTAAGSAVTVRVKVRNGGTGRAAASTTALKLSTDKRLGGDSALRPTTATPGLSPGRSWSGHVTVAVPAATATGSYYVLACADAKRRVREKSEGNNCRPSGRMTVTAPATSHELIEADVAAGVLTEEQGLVYKVFSDFADPRLPGKYAAPTNGLEEGALPEAAERWDELSPATQDTLRPFLVPAFYPGSHWTPAVAGRVASPDGESLLDSPWCSGSTDTQPAFQTWDHTDTAGGDFRIWWLRSNPGDKALADHMADVLTNSILPALSSYMGHSVKPDAGGLCDGGSAAVDIALVDTATAMTFPDGSCDSDGTSVHLLWPRSKPAPWAGIDPYLAHEVMHMIQFGMPSASSCGDASWLREMTAEWIQDYVTDPLYPVGLAPDDTEHLSATLYFQRPDVSLDATLPTGHDYGAYLFALWEARHGDRDFVRNVWANAASMNPTAAVNAALPGDGFDAVWPEFALSNWNRGPVRDYKDWDQLSEGAKPVGTQGVPVGTRHPTVHVEHLAAKYLTLDIDPGVTELEVTNDQAGEKDASLQAVIQYDDGSSKVVNLSAEPTTALCIDDGDKRATSVVLIFADANQTAPVDFAPTIEGRASCGCQDSAPKAAARAGATCTGNITFSWSHEVVKLNDDGSERSHRTETGSGTLGLAFVPDPNDPATWWSDAASTYTVSATAHFVFNGGCAETGDDTDEGAGALPDSATFATRDPDSDAVLVDNGILMAVTETTDAVTCGGSSHEVTTDHLVTPECPPTPQGGNTWWKFTPTAAGSKSYSYSCTGTVQYEDGLGQHTWTTTVSGTITLP